MLINGINARDYGVVSAAFNFGAAEVTTFENWLQGAAQPVIHEQQVQYSTCTLECIVHGTNRNDLERNISNLTAALKKCVVEFDSVSGSFDGFITGRNIDRLSANISKVTCELQGRRLSAEVTEQLGSFTIQMSSAVRKTIEVEGNAPVPYVLRFTTGSDLPQVAPVFRFAVDGTNAVVFSRLAAGTTYELDTAKGTFVSIDSSGRHNAIDGFGSYVLYPLPSGTVTMVFAPMQAAIPLEDVSITYKGRWQ